MQKNPSIFFDRLTDQSSEIECLFIERTKQLLKDGGLAGVILPSSILSNSGIYTKTREILFKYFEIVGITELGSGTFMATGTSTIILFLRKRNNYEWESMESAAKKFLQNYDDVTVNGVENIFSQYVKHAWTGITLEDYIDFCKGITNKNTENHEMYKEYQKKLKSKDFNDLRGKIIEKEIEKLLYFILAYNQKIILTKSGQKKEEKKFLGYEFSNRRGYEGIHPIQKTKSIDECTKMYNSENQEDETRANSYVYGAFLGKKNQVVHASLEKNVFEIGLLGAMDFNRAEFEKTISLTLKKKIKTENAWGTKNLVPLNQVANIQKGTSITQEKVIEGNIPVIAGGQTPAYFHNVANRNGNIITVSASGAYAGFVNYFHDPIFASDCNTIQSLNENAISTKLIYEFLKSTQEEFYLLQRGQAQPHVYGGDLENIKIPLPPKAIQEKIIDEIKHIESSNEKLVRRVEELRGDIKKNLSSSTSTKEKKLGNILTLQYGSPLTEGDRVGGKYPVMGSNGVVGYHNNFKICGPTIIIGRKGSAGKVTWVEQDNYPIDTTFYVEKTDDEVDYRFLYYILCDINLEKLVLGVGVPGLNRNDVYGQVYKVPPFEEQKRIVAQVVQIENEITEIKKELQESSDNKNVVLRKYLV